MGLRPYSSQESYKNPQIKAKRMEMQDLLRLRERWPDAKEGALIATARAC